MLRKRALSPGSWPHLDIIVYPGFPDFSGGNTHDYFLPLSTLTLDNEFWQYTFNYIFDIGRVTLNSFAYLLRPMPMTDDRKGPDDLGRKSSKEWLNELTTDEGQQTW